MKKKHPHKQLAQPSFWDKKDSLYCSLVLGLSLCLNSFGFGWGMDGNVPWSPDSIEGITTLREIPRLFGPWTNKYPRLQFVIDGACYKPLITSWERQPVMVQNEGKTQAVVFTPQRLKTLAMISRINILIMSALIILTIYRTARFYYGNSLAAFWASLLLAVCPVFVYYSHVTCVDIPSMFWITLGAWYLLRSIETTGALPLTLMAAALACACCTKDAMLFYAVALGITWMVLKFNYYRKQGLKTASCIRSLFGPNTWIAAGVFLFLFALIQGILFSPKAYWDRMSVWVGGRGVVDFNQNFPGHGVMLTGTLKAFYWAWGWPLLIALILGLILTLKKQTLFNIMVVIFPLVFFYVAVSMRVKMSFIRYYLPVMGLMCLPAGAWIAHLVSAQSRPLANTAKAAVSCIIGLSIMYCSAIAMEMITDTRNRIADWFRANVPQNTGVLSLIATPYGPNLAQVGYPTVENWTIPPLQVLLDNQKSLPDYVVYSDEWSTVTAEKIAFKRAMIEGKTAYTKAAVFNSREFLNPRKHILSIASWPLTLGVDGISPPLTVMKK